MSIERNFRNALVVLALGASTGAGATPAQAPLAAPTQRYQSVYELQPNSGDVPLAPLLLAPDGHLYGTSTSGGAHGNGTIFRWDTTLQQLTVLHSFADANPVKPASGLAVGPDGALYGLTEGGGLYNRGTAYRITLDGQYTLIHSFGKTAQDGSEPSGGSLTLAPDGNFYGTTTFGGLPGRGTAFQMSPSGEVRVLHRFNLLGRAGAEPNGQLMLASDGHFYGTTMNYGPGEGGALYRMTIGGSVSVVTTFSERAGRADHPEAAPTEGADGLLYGTTWAGGRFGCGVVYRVSKAGQAFATLHHFACPAADGSQHTDGSHPKGRLLMTPSGDLYGTTYAGGNRRAWTDGAGTVYKISAQGSYTKVSELGRTSLAPGQPATGLAMGADGWLYGTTVGAVGGYLYRLPQP